MKKSKKKIRRLDSLPSEIRMNRKMNSKVFGGTGSGMGGKMRPMDG